MATINGDTGVPDRTDVSQLSFHEQYAATQIRNNVGEIQNDIPALPEASPNSLTAINDSLFDGEDLDPEFKVLIVGAGAAGLFTGMLFDWLKEHYGIKVKYEIVEAKDEVGGRLFTYKFPVKGDDNGHQYYDVGAMRFPRISIMCKTYELFAELGMKSVCEDPSKVTPEELAKLVKNAPKGSLVPYYLGGPNTPALYNGVQYIGDNPTANAFGIKNIPEQYRDKDPGKLVDEHCQSFLDQYKKYGAEAFWKLLMEQGDKFTVRQYLAQQANYDYQTIEFLETLNFGNRWYDQAFSEMVCESLDFDANAPWSCVMGGAQEIAYRMRDRIDKQEPSRITYKKVVNSIGYTGLREPLGECLEVGFQGEDNKKQYHAVFNSAPLGAQQHMTLDDLNLNWGTKLAIRNLGYGASCKIGIRFKTLWWMTECGITKGGSAKTDQSIRCCVYPSYNIYDDKDKSGVLLASYTWSAEAEKIGALIEKGSPANEDELRELLFHDLALLHAKSGDRGDYLRLYGIIKDNYMDHFGYNWYEDKRSVGAFAFFGCGQFSNMWQWIIRTDGNYVIIGECASAHHAWVVGSLESAVRGVYQFLYKHSQKSAAIDRAIKAYNNNEVPGPYGPLPHEYDRTADIKYMKEDDVDVQSSPIGELLRQQVMVESIRQQQEQDQLEAKAVTKDQLTPFFPPEALKTETVSA